MSVGNPGIAAREPGAPLFLQSTSLVVRACHGLYEKERTWKKAQR